MCACAVGQAQTRIGYTNGSMGRDNVTRCGSGTLQGMAVRLGAEKLQLFKGHSISGVSVVYGSRNTEGGKARVFVSHDLSSAPAVEGNVTISRATTSWTDAMFDEPYVITGDEDALYVGTSMSIPNTYQALSCDFSQDVRNRCFVINNDEWIDSYGLGLGCVNVQVLIDGEAVSFADVMLKDIATDGYYKAGTEYNLTAEMLNFGTESIHSMNLEVKVGEDSHTFAYDNLTFEPGKTFELQIPAFVSEHDGEGMLSIIVKDVNGGSDADETDNTIANGIFFYPSDMQRSILVEEFTSQYCVNCPAGQASLSNMLQSRDEDFIKVMHHSGYQPDAFTMAIDGDVTIFYGSNSTYAPAVMFNRMICPQQSAVPVMNIGSSLVNGALNYIDNQHPYASLQLSTDYNPTTRELKLSFGVYCHRDMPEGDNVINLLLVQDGVIARQTGGSDAFVHDHICRGSLVDDAFGITIPSGTTRGTAYTWEKTLVLPESILSDYWADRNKPSYSVDIPVDAGNMQIVAYVAHRSEGNYSGNQVYNAISAKIGDSAVQGGYVSGIVPVSSSLNIYNKVYDLRGNFVGNTLDGLHPGIYIVSSSDGTRKKILKR